MNQQMATEMFAALREALSGDSRLARQVSLLAPTKKLARLLAGTGASLSETHLSSIGMPTGGLSSHCSREISGTQAHKQGDSHHAPAALS